LGSENFREIRGNALDGGPVIVYHETGIFLSFSDRHSLHKESAAGRRGRV